MSRVRCAGGKAQKKNHWRKFMRKKVFGLALSAVFFAVGPSAEAQQGKIHRIGVVHQGGPFQAVVDGLRDGLKESGYEDGKQIQLDIRDVKGDLGVVKEAAKAFEREKASLIYAVTSTVVTAAKEATVNVPIVFSVATDPVSSGLVQSFVKPGGRLTGVYYLTTDLTAKRLEILKEILPKLSRVVTFYNPNNPAPREAAKLGREAARHMKIQFTERHVTSVEELRQGLRTLKARETDAFFYISDGIVASQAQLIIDTAAAIKLPTMFQEQSIVAQGGLASYGQNFHEIGRLSAKYVQKVIAGAHPQDLRIETFDKFEMAINLKTAKQIGLTIPPTVLARADRVIK
jgi:putative tryptophan/tyrosine transport system substrate-binding protein